MSDLKRSCPGCDAWTSSVGAAFRDGLPCPYCGIGAEVVELLDRAAERGVSQQLRERLAQAEVRATAAEAEAARLRAVIWSVRTALIDAESAAEVDA